MQSQSGAGGPPMRHRGDSCQIVLRLNGDVLDSSRSLGVTDWVIPVGGCVMGRWRR